MKKIYETPLTEKVVLRGENLCGEPPGAGGTPGGSELNPGSPAGSTPTTGSPMRLYR